MAPTRSIRAVARDLHVSKNTTKNYLLLALQDPDTLWPYVEQAAEDLFGRERYNEYLRCEAKRILKGGAKYPTPPLDSTLKIARNFLNTYVLRHAEETVA